MDNFENGTLGQESHSDAPASDPEPPKYSDMFPELPTSSSRPVASTSAWSAPLRSTTKSKILNIPPEEVNDNLGQSFGRSSSNVIDEIEQKTKTKISMSKSSNGALSIAIVGRQAGISEAEKLILQKMQTQAKLSIPVPREYHGFLIGKGGENLKALQTKFAISINMPKQEDEKDEIVLKGVTQNIRKAAQEIKSLIDERAKKATVGFSAQKAYHPLICGYENSNIKAIEEKTGASIRVPPPSKENDEIHIAGERAAVDAAHRELIALYEKMKATCGELTAQVKKSQHRFVIGPKGASIHAIMKEFGVIVEVPPSESDSETIILRGPQLQLVHALAKVYERANSVVMYPIQVPNWLHRYIIGKSGANVKKISSSFPDVHLNFEDKSDVVEIEGPPEQVEAVKAHILALAQQLESSMTFADVKIEPKYHRQVVGRGYGNIRKIRDDTGAEIRVPDEDSSESNYHIEGTPDAVKQAEAALKDLHLKAINERSFDLVIPQRMHARLIGQQGARIKEIKEKYPDVVVDFPGRDDQSDIVKVRGPKGQVDQVKTFLEKEHKRIDAENFELEVPIFKQFHRDMIGRSGAFVNEVRKATNTRINIPAQNDPSDVITVIGLKANCEKARDMMLKKQNEVANIVTDEVTIESRFHDSIIGPKGRFVRSLQEEFGVQISFPSGAKKTEKRDVVFVKGPKENVPQAKQRLMEIAANKEKHGHTVEVNVPHEYIRYIVGAAGAAIKQLREDTGISNVLLPERNAEGDDKDTVVVIGTKESCVKAKAVLDARVEELKKVKEETVEIDPKYYPELKNRKANFLRSLSEDFEGVSVKLPKTEGDNKVLVKGNPDAVDGAVASLKEYCSEIDQWVERTLPIQYRDVPSMLGQGGSNAQRISKECRVKLDFPKRQSSKSEDAPSNEEEVSATGEEEVTGPVVTIVGTPENCDKAIAELKDLIPVTASVAMPVELHRFVIGPKGKTRQEINDTFNVRLEIPKAEENRAEIDIIGLPGNVENAKTGLQDRMSEFEDLLAQNHRHTIEIDSKFHSDLIGPRGATVNALRSKHNVRLDFPKDKASNEIVIIGYEQNCEECAKDIQQKVDELASYVHLAVDIHPAVHKRIIGPRGSTVKELQSKYGVKINFPRDNRDDFTGLIVIGPKEKADECIEELYMLEEENEELIDDYEQAQRFKKPKQQKKDNRNRSDPSFRVADAPWDSSAFPSLGNTSTSSAPTSSGAWGKSS